MKALKNEYWIKMSVEMLRSTTRDAASVSYYRM